MFKSIFKITFYLFMPILSSSIFFPMEDRKSFEIVIHNEDFSKEFAIVIDNTELNRKWNNWD